MKRIGRLVRWTAQVAPEVIYVTPNAVQTLQLGAQVSRWFGAPFVVFMTDDWPMLAPVQRQQREHQALQWGFAQATRLYAASDLMAEIYSQRYGIEFGVFYYPVEVERWMNCVRTRSDSDIFLMRYTGMITEGAHASGFQDMCETVVALGEQGYPVRFELYCPDWTIAKYRGRFERLPWVTFRNMVPYDQVPQIMADADLLVICWTFVPSELAIFRMSFPTKLPEYMASGTPALMYGPDEAAPVAYALEEGFAYTLTERNDSALRGLLIHIMESPEERHGLGARAQKLVLERHAAEVVRARFWQDLRCAANQDRDDKSDGL